MSAKLIKNRIEESELILNSDGSIYHLNLLPHQIADTIILVGDQERVPKVSKYFDSINFKIQKREFLTHTGKLGKKEISVVSTGIGTDNIDIVLNELDALVNINFQKRQVKSKLTRLNLIRIGTSGTIQKNIPVDSFIVSEYGLGIDAMLPFYNVENTPIEIELSKQISAHLENRIPLYLTKANEELLEKLGTDFEKGITVTAPGFYAPQGRTLRGQRKFPNLIEELAQYEHSDTRITNLEMETAGIYGLAKVIGHRAISFNAILANRVTGDFSEKPSKTVKDLIKIILEKIENDI